MTLSLKTLAISVSALVLTLGLAAADSAETRKQLLELSGGRRVKVAWNQGTEGKEPSAFKYPFE